MGLLQYKIRELSVLADTVVNVNHEVESAIVSKIQDLKRRGKGRIVRYSLWNVGNVGSRSFGANLG